MIYINGVAQVGVTTHAALTDVSTPHVLADLENAVCSEDEADAKIEAARLYSKVKQETRDVAAASGDVSYTGYGFEPTGLVVFSYIEALADVLSLGIADSAEGMRCLAQTYTPALSSLSYLVYLNPGSGDTQRVTAISYGVDGFTLTWLKAGSPTGTGNLDVLALR